MLLIGVLLPSAYGLMAGYSIQSLRREGQRMDADQASLELQEAGLLSPSRIQELAKQQQVDPAGLLEPATSWMAYPLALTSPRQRSGHAGSGHAGKEIGGAS